MGVGGVFAVRGRYSVEKQEGSTERRGKAEMVC